MREAALEKGDYMELMEAIKTRRSIRKFTDEPVPREKLEKIIEAAMWAPSGQNLQPWYFVALTNDEDLSYLIAEMGTTAFSERKKLEERFKNNPEVVEETMEFLTALGGARTVLLAFLINQNTAMVCCQAAWKVLQLLCRMRY